MIFETLVLEDVGVFAGRQTLELKPLDPERPIVLIGGLNGAGKTTILDALWLVLYGNRTPAPARVGVPYQEYLRRLIHKNAHPMKGARIELTLSYYEQGRLIRLTIKRHWCVMGNKVFEDLQVWEDESEEALASLDWPRQIESLMPLALMRVFFFEGGDVQRLLRAQESESLQEICEEALGLTLTRRLSEDLLALEQRKRRDLGNVKGHAVRFELESLQQLIDTLEEQRRGLSQQLAGVTARHDELQHRLENLDEAYVLAGGALYEERQEWSEELRSVVEELTETEEAIKELLYLHGPLLLLERHTEVILAIDAREQSRAIEEQLGLLLKKREEELLSFLATHEKDPAVIAKVRDFFLHHRKPSPGDDEQAICPLRLGPQARQWLEEWKAQGAELHRRRLQALILRSSALKIRREQLESFMLRLPEAAELEALHAERQGVAEEARALQSEREALGHQLEQLDLLRDKTERRFLNRAQSQAKESLEIEDLYRLLVFSGRTRAGLTRFRELLIARRLRQLTDLIEDSFIVLMRKQGLAERLVLDPQQWLLSLVDGDGTTQQPENLSTGERQLLSHALQWGIARACGRPLPVIIDAPLAHLDSNHRANLVERYFPAASHQLLLLSTDEEIDENLRKSLERHISRDYVLSFDEDMQATTIVAGYFSTPPPGLQT